MNTATQTTIQKQPKVQSEKSQPWNVVVFDDPVNLMNYVTMVFKRVFGYPTEKAEKMMMEVHEQGRSIVWTGGREKAELYTQQLHTWQLRASIEKAT